MLFQRSHSQTSVSRSSVLPHWSGRTYTRYASRFYELATRVTGWKTQLAQHAFQNLPSGPLLDVGCGTGYFMYLATQKGLNVFGIDASEGMIQKAQSIYGFRKPRINVAPAESIPFQDHSFHSVVSFGTLVHIPQIEEAISEINRVLIPGGILRVIDHAPPIYRNWKTPFSLVFSQLSGDIIHDYEALVTPYAELVRRKTLGRGGLLQQFDFQKLALRVN